MIPNGSLVRLVTTNGGNNIAVVADVTTQLGYVPTYGCWFRWPNRKDAFYVEAERIASVVQVSDPWYGFNREGEVVAEFDTRWQAEAALQKWISSGVVSTSPVQKIETKES